ncbi:MAG: uroporphyrinogen-III synthase [Pseudomonadota bacterium]|nr:uroporphyrinogen-III synthase [Pseudomonadota bacterium]
MTCVWITRSEPGASRLEGVLTGAGFQSIKAPVLTTEMVKEPAPSSVFDVTVFVSEHAVKHALQRNWRAVGPVLAVGQATADALRSKELETLQAARASSEGILELLEEQYPNAGSVLIVAGANGRTDLAEWLKEKGVRVSTWITYRRVMLEPSVDLGACDVVVASSADALSRIAELCFAHSSFDGDQLPVLVPSNRAAEIAASFGFKNIVNSNGADPHSVIATLIRL